MKLSKTYEPQAYEQDIYNLWEQAGDFAPSEGQSPFSIVMPPPNANGNLHIGHALTVAVQDAAIRYHRLKGDSTLYLPGADHAGFETQVVYEKELEKQGKSRFDFTREELYDQIWQFVDGNKDNMLAQTRALGASADWSRFTFTLDEPVVTTAYQTFKRLWDDKLIYRGERLVNYCTTHRTGFADIEVEYEEVTSPLYYLQYGPFTLATTRPETKFGDTAVAVHPEDERYQQYVGQTITAEGIEGPFEIRVVADEMVDPEFGTGAVKITPAHDFNDWEVAQRHSLEAVRVINHDGTMNHRAGRFEGLPVIEARAAVAKALKAKGLLKKVDKNYKNRVGHCYKCGTVIEPMLLDQWFIRVEPLAEAAIKALDDDKITFYPASKKAVLKTYLQNLKDWNISRQIAWGIPIPAFQSVDDPDEWIYDEAVDQEIIERNGRTYHRDPDVFDTWFSSGLWPFVTLGYPDNDDFKRFYPLSLMETGYDILYQWVARMIMLGLYVTGKVPFTAVYLHGLVLDEHGQKMSKSKGNVVNPMEVLETYGSDALRMGLLSGRSPGQNQAFAPDKIIGARNFANKLWNVARYIEGVLGDDFTPSEPKAKFAADDWLLLQLNNGIAAIGNLLEEYRFSEAYEALYRLVWNDYADWYVEVSKIQPNHAVLAHGLSAILKLAHPFAPFVTETIWQTLTWTDGNLIRARWPEAAKADTGMAEEFENVKAIITEIRDLTAKLHIRENTLYHHGSSFIDENAELIVKMAKIFKVDSVKSGRGLRLTQSNVDAWLDVEHNIIRDYESTLKKQQGELEQSKSQLQARLDNKTYVKKAPKSLVSETKRQLEETTELLTRVEAQIKAVSESLES